LSNFMRNPFPRPPKVMVELPGTLTEDCEYGLQITPEAQKDKIIRILKNSIVVIEIHPDGRIEYFK
jgi:hypothetical protein